MNTILFPHAKYNPSCLFDNEGYILLSDYIRDIRDMMNNGPWKIPLGPGDRFHLFILSIFSRLSWFSSALFIKQGKSFSPAYSLLLSHLRKRDIFDSLLERHDTRQGYYSFVLQKKASIDGKKITIAGQGVAEDKATALSIAMGEIMERVITGIYDTNRKIIRCSADELSTQGRKFLFPPKFHHFLEAQKRQYGVLGMATGTPLAWVEGKNVLTKEAMYIPHQMTSWLKGKEGNVMVHATTNGSAGYFSKDEAVLRGLFEVVERDGFLVHWLTQTAPEVIEKESLPADLREPLVRFEEKGVATYVLNVTSLDIPAVVIAAIGKNVTNKPQVVISGGCNLTFHEAIASATKELAVALEMLLHTEDNPTSDATVQPFVSSLDKVGRQMYWRGEEKVRKFSWFISGRRVSFNELEKAVDLPNAQSKIDECASRLRRFGEEYMPIVYHPVNVIQEELGFHIAQVFIPKAFPFYLYEGYGTFDSVRLREFALSKGQNDFMLNKEPHMFS
jgi:thiazole/oxazole-forming peptide maturase SagD family component